MSKGLFAGRTRHLARHHMPGKLGISELLKTLNIGDKVAIVPKGNFKDIPHPRYRGRSGVILATRGKSYEVQIRDGRAKKVLIVPAVHLKLQATEKKVST